MRSLFRVLLFLIASAVVLAFVAPFARRFPGKEGELFLGVVTSLATFGLTALFVRWERLRLADVGAMPNARSVARLAAGLLIGTLTIATWAGIWTVVCRVRWARANAVDASSVVIAMLAYLFLACREELGFRGFPLRVLHRRFGLWPAQGFVAIMFALEHKLAGGNWVGAFLGAGVGSLLFGMAAIASKGLALPIGIHAAWNFGHWALGFKGTPGLWSAVIDAQHQPHAYLIAMIFYDVVILGVTFAFWFSARSREN